MSADLIFVHYKAFIKSCSNLYFLNSKDKNTAAPNFINRLELAYIEPLLQKCRNSKSGFWVILIT